MEGHTTQFPLGDHCQQLLSIPKSTRAREHSDLNWQFPLFLNNAYTRGWELWHAHSSLLSLCCHGVRTPPRDAHHCTGTIILGQPHLRACLTAQFHSTQWHKEEKRQIDKIDFDWDAPLNPFFPISKLSCFPFLAGIMQIESPLKWYLQV